MPHPAPGWIDRLPQNRLIAEYSMWSADLIRLADDLDRIAPHADILHVDVADGVFAPSFLFFPDLVARMRAVTVIPIHVHLMVADGVLLSQVAQFAEAGADLISLHVENAAVAAEALDLIEGLGLKAGMVLRVETPVATVQPWLGRLDFLTLLGTAIGVKGAGAGPVGDGAADGGGRPDCGHGAAHCACGGWGHPGHDRAAAALRPGRDGGAGVVGLWCGGPRRTDALAARAVGFSGGADG